MLLGGMAMTRRIVASLFVLGVMACSNGERDATLSDDDPRATPNQDGGASDGGLDLDNDSGSTPAPAPAATMTGNLIVNGGGESAAGSSDAQPVETPGWTSSGSATAVAYDVPDYLAATDPGPNDRGLNFLCGGPMDLTSSLTQTVDLAMYAAAIDAGKVTFTLSGYLGGYTDQGDNAVLTITYKDTAGTSVGSPASIGPVSAADRADATGILSRSTTGAVPAQARTVEVQLLMTRTTNTSNDGYADNLSLILNGI